MARSKSVATRARGLAAEPVAQVRRRRAAGRWRRPGPARSPSAPSRPVSPSRTASGMPLCRVATTGRPSAAASRIVVGRPSVSPSRAVRDGRGQQAWTRPARGPTSAGERRRGTSRPRASSRARTPACSGSSGPAPMNTRAEASGTERSEGRRGGRRRPSSRRSGRRTPRPTLRRRAARRAGTGTPVWCTRTLAGSAPHAIGLVADAPRRRRRPRRPGRRRCAGCGGSAGRAAPGAGRLPGHVVAVHGDDQRDAETRRGPADQPAVAAEVGVHEVRRRCPASSRRRRGERAGEAQAEKPAASLDGNAMRSASRASGRLDLGGAQVDRPPAGQRVALVAHERLRGREHRAAPDRRPGASADIGRGRSRRRSAPRRPTTRSRRRCRRLGGSAQICRNVR